MPQDDQISILVVDDEPFIAGVIRAMLRGSIYRAHFAAGGEEALEVCKRPGLSLHLVLTDVVMPNMNGDKLWDCIRQIHPKATVIFMSGFPEYELKPLPDAPPSYFLAKPFSKTDLLKILNRATAKAVSSNG